MKKRIGRIGALVLVVVCLLVLVVSCAPFFTISPAGTTALIERCSNWEGSAEKTTAWKVSNTMSTEIAVKAVHDAALMGRTVTYVSDSGQIIKAAPVEYIHRTMCYIVRVRIWQDSNLVEDEAIEVCDYL